MLTVCRASRATSVSRRLVLGSQRAKMDRSPSFVCERRCWRWLRFRSNKVNLPAAAASRRPPSLQVCRARGLDPRTAGVHFRRSHKRDVETVTRTVEVKGAQGGDSNTKGTKNNQRIDRPRSEPQIFQLGSTEALSFISGLSSHNDNNRVLFVLFFHTT